MPNKSQQIRTVPAAETWQAIYRAYQDVNFTAFDYNTVKQSLVDYIQLYFPEKFNDWIESSEFVAQLELFAYISELMIYRFDLNAHENLWSTAQRKESILRLAQMISYQASRNIPARGLVKLISISTSQQIIDSSGTNLANTIINWNDPNNSNWRAQFLQIINQVLQQAFGTVTPTERVQVDNVLFELYSTNIIPSDMGVYTYSATVGGSHVPMEIVPAELTHIGPYEKRPQVGNPFTMLYGNDGLGDQSPTTGFFMFTKQGILNNITYRFDGKTPNQIVPVLVNNINQTDVWVQQIDPTTYQIIDDDTNQYAPSGEWFAVNGQNAENIAFNFMQNSNKYQINTENNDQIQLLFGDGQFANIPAGLFQIFYRVSSSQAGTIPQSAISNQPISFQYFDDNGTPQTLTLAFSAISSMQNASAGETLDHIRRIAPLVYSTQDRMTSATDYNNYPLRDSSILKLSTINRTYAGDSQYTTWNDPSGIYSNIKLFGDDLAIYFDSSLVSLPTITNVISPTAIVTGYLQPLLSSSDISSGIFNIVTSFGVDAKYVRKTFTTSEISDIVTQMAQAQANSNATPVDIYLFVNGNDQKWQTSNVAPAGYVAVSADAATYVSTNPIPIFTVTSITQSSWDITFTSQKLLAYSKNTNFWNTNQGQKLIDYSTARVALDTITILKANQNAASTNLLLNDQVLNIVYQNTISQGINIGLPDTHNLISIPNDVTSDGVPDNLDLTGSNVGPNILTSMVNVSNYQTDTAEFIYFTRISIDDPWIIYTGDKNTANANWLNDSTNTWKKVFGRYPLNFLWQHVAADFHLINPATTNINDMLLIQRGYYLALRQWLNGYTSVAPVASSAYQLQTDYQYILNNKMMSDTVLLKPGKFKILFGSYAEPELQASFKIVRNPNGRLTNNQIKTEIVAIIQQFFTIEQWDFGQTFYFTKLSTVIQSQLASEIQSVIIVPTHSPNVFGSLFQVFAASDEILQPHITTSGVDIISSLTSSAMHM